MSARWREHEEIVATSSVYDGYNLQTQKWSRSARKRPDFFGISKNDPRKRIVGDAKWTITASRKHVDQVVGYKRPPFYAQIGVLHYPKNVNISDDVRKYAKSKNVMILMTEQSKCKTRRPGFFGFLWKKFYER